MYTLAEAATILDLRNTRILRRYLRIADITPTLVSGDRRWKLLTDDDLDALRKVKAAVPSVAHSDARQHALPVEREGLDLYARIATLERRIATLEAQAARRITPPAPAAPHEPVIVPSDIPDGALQAGPFAQQIGVPETTLRRWVERGDIEAVNRASRIPGHTERWLTLAGQQQARERATARRGA